MNIDKIPALLLEALDYEMGPVPESLIREALSLVSGESVQCDGGRHYFSDGTVPWLAVLVKPGDRYGRLDRDTGARWLVNNTSKPLIEFWDRRYPHDREYKAQFVTRYYLKTFLEHEGSLRLDTAAPEWTLSAPVVQALQQVLRSAS